MRVGARLRRRMVPRRARSKSLRPATETSDLRGERRQVTVLFCDLVGSTELAERLDPEELCQVMRHYQATCVNAIQPFGAYLAQTLGDGLLFYFGFPTAHEDDALRAVSAGLAAVSAVNDPCGSPVYTSVRCAVRVGIHTGVVYAGEVGQFDTRAAHALVGDTPNIAARLQSLASPGDVLIGPSTRKLIGEHFLLAPLGLQQLKGLSLPLEVFRVRGEYDAASRFEVRRKEGVAPIFGRDRELEQLLSLWARAEQGQGQTVIVSGVAGIGKSRLAQALRESIAPDARVMVFQCSPYFQTTALHPLIGMLRRAARIVRSDSAERKLRKLERALRDPDGLTLIARLLRIPAELSNELEQQSGNLLSDTMTWAMQWLVDACRQRPLLILLEDAHWSDSATRDLVEKAARALAQLRVLVLITQRSGPSELDDVEGVVKIELQRLGYAPAHAIIRRFAGVRPLRRGVIEQIVSRSEGIPFFVEELTKAVIEGSDGRTQFAVPATLKDSLMARLDSAGQYKAIAQRAACIGVQFNQCLLASVCGGDEKTLARGLQRLVELELLRNVSDAPHERYAFPHSLLQQAAYESLLLQERRAVHLAIAHQLERTDPLRIAQEPEILARHYSLAGEARIASRLWLRAGELAQRRSNHADATSYLNESLQSLTSLESTPEDQRLEIEVQLALARSRTSAEGWGGDRVQAAYCRALDLSRALGDRAKELDVLWGLCTSLETRGKLDDAAALAREYVAVAEREASPVGLQMAHCAAFMVSFFQGHLSEAQDHATAVKNYYRHGDGEHWLRVSSHDPFVLTSVYQSVCTWLQGYPDRAAEQSRRAITLARALQHPFQLCHALLNGSWVHVLRQDHVLVRTNADEALAMAGQLRMLLFAVYGPLMLAPAYMARQPNRTTLNWLEGCYKRLTRAGVMLHVPPYLSHLARAYLQVERFDEAQGKIDQAIDIMESTGERWIEPELYRVKAAVEYARAPHSDAGELALWSALHKARVAGARSLELRIACDLCSRLGLSSRSNEGRELVASVISGFTEGFETADLCNARAWLS